MKKLNIVITGKVQGVGFRYWLYQIANEKNVYGWVKNINTNEVEAVFLGEEKKVDEIIKLCRKGPTSSNVVSVKIEDYQQEYTNKSFDIL